MTSVNSCVPRHPEWETRVAAQDTQSGRQVRETSGRQVESHAAQGTQSGRQGGHKLNSCGPRNPEWETVGDKCKLMRPKAPRVGDKGETRGRQV